MLITVTQRHIDMGYQDSDQSCPIALAIKDALLQAGYPRVWASVTHRSIALIGKDGVITEYVNPLRVTEFVRSYDMKGLGGLIYKKLYVQPFSFELPVTYTLYRRLT